MSTETSVTPQYMDCSIGRTNEQLVSLTVQTLFTLTAEYKAMTNGVAQTEMRTHGDIDTRKVLFTVPDHWEQFQLEQMQAFAKLVAARELTNQLHCSASECLVKDVNVVHQDIRDFKGEPVIEKRFYHRFVPLRKYEMTPEEQKASLESTLVTTLEKLASLSYSVQASVSFSGSGNSFVNTTVRKAE